MVLGEGGGMIVIERESWPANVERKCMRTLPEWGRSSNNFGMIESSRITQEIAIASVFR